MKRASLFGDVFITTTGCKDVIGSEAIKELKDGAILANAGHFNVEISVPELERQSVNKSQVNDNIVRYNLNHKKVYLIGEGRLVNLVATDGNPSEVMDMSFANQFLSVLKLAESKGSLQPLVYSISREQDQEIALAKLLKSMNVEIDTLTADQKTYIGGFSQGT